MPCRLLTFCFLLTAAAPLAAQPAPEIELQRGAETLRGKSLAHDKHHCWLLSDDGRLQDVKLSQVTSYRKSADRFRPQSLVDLRDALRKEYGKQLEVATKGSYIVCGPRGKAGKYAELLHEVHRAFSSYFSRRQFKLDQPEFPLVVLVFETRQDFEDYAARDRTTVADTLQGYYNLKTNRVALYEDARLGRRDPGGDELSNAPLPSTVAASINAGPLDTLIHEAIHQLAFNTGLHSRVGSNPRWVVEGLAMLFEDESRRDDARSAVSDRINRARFAWFMNARQERRPKRHLEAFLAGDEEFNANTLDAYSEAWALSFYLIETRPQEYSKYLRAIAARDPLQDYPPEERLTDFKSAFGNDLNWLEGQYLQYLDKIR